MELKNVNTNGFNVSRKNLNPIKKNLIFNIELNKGLQSLFRVENP